MSNIGYIRVSTAGQNQARQLAGLEFDRTFEDTATGSSTDRPGLTALFDYVREGDSVTIHSLDRLARSVVDLLNLLQQFTDKGVAVRFHKENLNYDPDDHFGKLMIQQLAAFAEFEKSIIKERAREGIEKAKKRGAYKNHGRISVWDTKKQRQAEQWLADGESMTNIAINLGISRSTLFKHFKKPDQQPLDL